MCQYIYQPFDYPFVYLFVIKCWKYWQISSQNRYSMKNILKSKLGVNYNFIYGKSIRIYCYKHGVV